MQRLLLLLVAAALALGAGCRQQDLRTMNVKLAGVAAESDVQAVSNAVSKLDGVFKDTIAFSGTESMTVKYDSMKLARKNIEYAIAAAGYGANEIPATRNPEATPQPRRLP